MSMKQKQTALIQDEVRSLLTRGEIDLFIGYKAGSNPLRISPCIVQDEGEVEQLVWNLSCINNLVASLHKYAGQKVGILVKGCDSQSLIELLKLHQVRRDDLYIIGVTCTGVLDTKKVSRTRPAANITSLSEHDERIIIYEKSGEIVACDKDELLYDKCRDCTTPTPLLFDMLVGDETAPTADPASRFADLEELEQADTSGRFAFWQEQLSRCTLCYACQTICPMCFCKDCSLTLERSDPRKKNRDRAAIFAYHLNRAYHMVGRCTGCMECDRVCPVDIPLQTIFKKVRKETLELFDYEAGVERDAIPPLSTFADADHEGSTL